ncbi:spore germination protein [Paenibacillus mucilaginosus 3016]|uniref:Spore germination protein n=1 Tax=Paenibacillus mucilaginosus 3016 TaxID=1116391 RepID=H6NBC9_9BACL|nr:endospore germination permease [Paenibacillus mucilaginosus]AFC32875.1 spore germination protein [Paenibacillus mucilaginosus 3016]
MLEKGRISSIQLAFLIYPVIIATGDLTAPALTAKHAGRDLWISPFIASLVGVVMVLIVNRLSQWYPGKTIVEYSEDILGKAAGKLLSALLLLFYLYICANILRQYSELIVGNYFSLTPVVVISTSMLLVCSFAVRGGGEVLARASQIMVPVIFLSWVIIIALLLPDMKPERMLPIMEKGIQPAFMGAVPLFTWFHHFGILAFFFPILSDRHKGLKWSLIAILVVTLVLTAINTTVLMIFGNITTSLTYPTISAARYISIAEFLTRLESIVMALWVAGAFLKLSVFYYALALGSAQCLGLNDYRFLLFPFGILITVYSFWLSPSLQEFSDYMGTSNVFFNYSMELGIPLLLFLVALLRRRKSA